MHFLIFKILKDVAEQESAKQEGLVVERAYKALRRSYDTKISQEKALPSRLRVQRQVLGRGDMFTRIGPFPDEKAGGNFWTHLSPKLLPCP